MWITIITPDSGVPETLRASGIALAERADRLEADRTLFDNQILKLGTMELSEETLKAVDSSRSNRILMWQMELQLRSDYSRWLTAYDMAIGDMVNQAIQDRLEAEDELVGRLTELGYRAGAGSELLPERITPEMIARHPSVRGVRLRESDLEAKRTGIDSTRHANTAAQSSVTAEMVRYRAELLAGI